MEANKNKGKDKPKGKTKGGAMLGRIIWEVVKILITAFIITNIVNIILMGALLPRFERHAKGGKYFVSPTAQTVRTPAGSYFESLSSLPFGISFIDAESSSA